MFMTVHYAIRLNGPRLDSFPALANWYQRIGERPSAARVDARARPRANRPVAFSTWWVALAARLR